eukprot:8983084-Alexandrium_andersonii.AAC.1
MAPVVAHPRCLLGLPCPSGFYRHGPSMSVEMSAGLSVGGAVPSAESRVWSVPSSPRTEAVER